MTQETRKPRLLVAGEFSAGKTQLINGLLGVDLLPANVTSTSLPPIWLSADHAADLVIGADGTRQPLGDLTHVPVEGTLCCQMRYAAPILDYVDLIDTPGNSDPNIDAASWMRMLDAADMVIWCTNAVQAWRQAEKAVWQHMPARLRANATLVVTHADRLQDSKTADRLMRRVLREADGFFDHHILASLMVESDLDFIANHVVNQSETIAHTGTELTIRAAAHPSVAPSSAAAPRRVMAGAVRQLRTAPPAPAGDPATNVVPLFEGSSPKTRAEEIWAELVKSSPPVSPEDWQAMMSKYMRAVDAELGPMADGTPPRHLSIT